jgi:hypothetical protein
MLNFSTTVRHSRATSPSQGADGWTPRPRHIAAAGTRSWTPRRCHIPVSLLGRGRHGRALTRLSTRSSSPTRICRGMDGTATRLLVPLLGWLLLRASAGGLDAKAGLHLVTLSGRHDLLFPSRATAAGNASARVRPRTEAI